MVQASSSLAAIVMLVHEDSSLDFPSLYKFIDWHIVEGTDGIVIIGASGESPIMSMEEHRELTRVAVEQASKCISIIAGTSDSSITEATEPTAYIKQVGADASLQVVPYHNKPVQEGIYPYLRKAVESVDLPAILYNVSGRTVADMAVETMLRLAEVPSIIGAKKATGSIDHVTQLIKSMLDSFKIYSGSDSTAITLMLLGGYGNTSMTANAAPRAMHELCVAAMRGGVETVRHIHMQLLSVHKNLPVESNPIPVGWTSQTMGRIGGGIRLSLMPLTPQYHEVVHASLKNAGLLS